MSRYLTRNKVRRVYSWGGRPCGINRKLQLHFHESLHMITNTLSEALIIKPGQHILIEGDDEDNPYVAQLLKLYENGVGKRAEVQWFVHYSEVPHNKRKLLGRKPHPREVFFYPVKTCDNEIDAETIIGTVEIVHLPADAAFPETSSADKFYVKLAWDSKSFNVLNAEEMQQKAEISSPPVAHRALPTPDMAVMKRALHVSLCHLSKSAGKLSMTEAESGHSACKLSASRQLSRKRRSSCSSTPGVRKKLDLNSPEKELTKDDVLAELLDEEIQNARMLAQKLPSTPPKCAPQAYSLSPLKQSSRKSASLYKMARKPLSPISSPFECQESTRDTLGFTPLEAEDADAQLRTDSYVPVQRGVTPRRSSLRVKARTPSHRRDSSSVIAEPVLGVVAEVSPEVTSMTAVTPRTRRKSAKIVSSRIRKQLSLLDTTQELCSDDNDDDDDRFVPSKKDLESSTDEEDGESEDDYVVKRKSTGRTPRSAKKASAPIRTPRKTSSRKAVPRTPRTPRHATPSIPARSQPVRNPGNVLEEARARLHVSSVPESLPCREQEFEDIYSFVESKIIDGTGGCMYISGVPGTGKTATVHEVIRCLQHAVEQDEIPSFRFIEINGMKMTDPHQAYVQILQKLTEQKVTADHAAALLEKRFSNPAPKKETTVLLVDELDLLWTRKQNVMYNLFDWPTRRHARLVVLAIANTMDLPERIMINRVASRLGLTRMSFQPYTFKQLQQIITSRLNRVKAFEEDSLQLVSRKVAALSGDARRCLDICRRATEICEHSANQQTGCGLVGMSHVMEALDEMFSSCYITAIRCASVQEQLFLRAVIAEFRRLGLEEATFQQVFVQHQALCRVEGLQPISVSEGLAVCQRLGACRLLLLEPSRFDLLLRVRLNVSQDDVLYALKED